jgi:mono/diheme cytochrome c family protein
MRSFSLLVPVMCVAVCCAALAQTPAYNGVGRTPSEAEIRSWDISIGPAGKELPPGRGTAKGAAEIYSKKCAACHGPTGEGTATAPHLLGGKGTLSTLQPVRTIGSYWPFATTVWDYINRAMPLNQGGTLTPDEVYALTAWVLYRNDIIQESDVMDATSLPKVQMPNRNGFVPQRLEDIADMRKRGCRLGHCP